MQALEETLDESPKLPPRRGHDVQKAVINAAFKGIVPGSAVRRHPLFSTATIPSVGGKDGSPPHIA
jgi:hypothetical protein